MIDEIKAMLCTCDVCGHSWKSFCTQPPTWCPNPECRSREWNGKKYRKHGSEIKLPAPRKGGRPKTIAVLGDEF